MVTDLSLADAKRALMLAAMLASTGLFGMPSAALPFAARPVCKLELGEGHRFKVTVDNRSTLPIDALVSARLVLLPTRALAYRSPFSFQRTAELDLSSDVAAKGEGGTRLNVPASSAKTWNGRLTDLSWRSWQSRQGKPYRDIIPESTYAFGLYIRSGDYAKSICDAAGGRVRVHADGSIALEEDPERHGRGPETPK